MRGRPFESAFLCGAATATVCALAVFASLESSKAGAFFCLLAGAAIGYGYRSARASDAVPEQLPVSRLQRSA